jgi:Icc-related predicted phosphoesterase/uncharacterized protein YprB with RNaseH-like and TPR domain
MQIFAFSDWRTQPIDPLYKVLRNLDPAPDLILYGGDDIGRFVGTSCNHFHGLAQAADAELGFVLGNDDRPEALQDLQVESSRVTDLHQSNLRVSDFAILGHSGDIGESAMGYIQYSEDQARNHLEESYADAETDHHILVSHTPPRGALDYAQRHSSQRIGSTAVREFAIDTSPVFILCGHVHQFGGQTVDRDYGHVVNAASHDFEGAAGRIALIEIEDTGAEPDIETTHTHLQQLARDVSGPADTIYATPLRKLTQIALSRAEELQEAGIETIADVATQSREAFLNQTPIPNSCLERAHSHSLAFHHEETRISDSDKYARLRDDDTVLVDIETNLKQTQIWCIGIYSFRDDEFTQLVSLEDEQSLIEDFHEYLKRQGRPTVVYYAGNSFDENKLVEAADRANLELADVLSDWVDLCLIARRTIFRPEKGHELDTIASGLGYVFAHPDVGGLEIGHVYSAYQSEGEVPEDGWGKYLRYNLDDVLAIKHILDVVAEYGDEDGRYIGEVDETNAPEDRVQYQIADVPSNEGPTTEEDGTPSGSGSQGGLADFVAPAGAISNPYEILDEGEPTADWTEENPVNDRTASRKTTDQESTNSSETGTATSAVSTGQETSPRESVTCHDCGDSVAKTSATGKYRINDGETLWYCLSCK